MNQVFTADGFEASVADSLADYAALPPSALTLTKRLLNGHDGMSFQEGIARGAELNAVARSTRACREGVRRFLEGPRGS